MIAFMDNPNERSSHSTPTPRGGGVGILLAFVVVGFLFIKNNAIVSIVGCAGILGLLEDRFTFSSKLRLFIQIILSILAVGSMFLGFAFAVFVVELSTSINIFLCLIMFLYLFYADAIATFYCRWRKGDNPDTYFEPV